MKADDLVDTLQSFNPLSDERNVRIRQGEFIQQVLEELESLEQIRELADREEQIAEVMEEALEELDDLIRVLGEDEPSAASLKKLRKRLEEIDDSLRDVKTSFSERTEEGHIIRPIELSVDLEIAIEDLQNLIELPSEEIEELKEEMDVLDVDELVEDSTGELEEILDELKRLENRTLDAAESVEPREIELKIDQARRKLERRKKEFSGTRSEEVAGIASALDELDELIPEPTEPRGSWMEFMEFLGLGKDELDEGMEEISKSNQMLEDPEVYERMINSVRMVVGPEQLQDVSIIRRFETKEDGFIDYSHSKVRLRIDIDGEPDEKTTEICYNVLMEPSEISGINIRGEEVVHIDSNTCREIGNLFRELNTYETELGDVSDILEEKALK